MTRGVAMAMCAVVLVSKSGCEDESESSEWSMWTRLFFAA